VPRAQALPWLRLHPGFVLFPPDLDFETGRVYDYDFQSLEVLLMKDPELHDEYAQLRRKKKRQLKFLYLRRFNERNPLYLPQN